MWTRLEDSFYDHPKVMAAGNEALGLYVRGLTYCSRHLTDGLIPKRMAQQLADGNPEAIDALLAAKLWAASGDNYRIPRYLDYHPTREEYEKTREERRK